MVASAFDSTTAASVTLGLAASPEGDDEVDLALASAFFFWFLLLLDMICGCRLVSEFNTRARN